MTYEARLHKQDGTSRHGDYFQIEALFLSFAGEKMANIEFMNPQTHKPERKRVAWTSLTKVDA